MPLVPPCRLSCRTAIRAGRWSPISSKLSLTLRNLQNQLVLSWPAHMQDRMPPPSDYVLIDERKSCWLLRFFIVSIRWAGCPGKMWLMSLQNCCAILCIWIIGITPWCLMMSFKLRDLWYKQVHTCSTLSTATPRNQIWDVAFVFPLLGPLRSRISRRSL